MKHHAVTGMTESSADARGPATSRAQDAADKASIVLSLPHQRTPTDPPIMALAGASPKATPCGAAYGRP